MKKPKPKGRNDGHQTDYSKITNKIYIGSDLCKGNVCPVHNKDFKHLGVTVEINLSAEKTETPPDMLTAYSWLPVVDGYAPDPTQMEMGACIIHESVEDGKTVYIHCKNGHGRSPTLVAAYLIKCKEMGVEEAIGFIAKARPEIHIEDTQRRALVNFARKWSK